ncbi:reverse transcriptase domain-containing protein [Streptomyces sp. NBC_01768]|uniref:RNA-directed DNA polymerase n=1 Tax=Streptomyces sp. NBC_01768 TaxID=2975938 RepID=UPI003FA39076
MARHAGLLPRPAVPGQRPTLVAELRPGMTPAKPTNGLGTGSSNLLSCPRPGRCIQQDRVTSSKDPVSVRPLVRFSIRDRILYESLVFGLAHSVDKEIFPSVYSYRWNRLSFSFRDPIKMWLRMQKAASRHLVKNPTHYAAKTDVTSFYESIHLETLTEDLEAATGQVEWVNKLRIYLDSFQSFHSAWGIPQGSDASGILANLYLLPVDELLRRRGVRSLRARNTILLRCPGRA